MHCFGKRMKSLLLILIFLLSCSAKESKVITSFNLVSEKNTKLSQNEILDSEGIIIYRSGGKRGTIYNPVTISLFSLANYSKYCRTGGKI